MKKEKNEFEEYRSGFFFQRFNRLLGLIRRHRVLPIRPGWEQTPDGIVPPPIYSSEASAIKRPFQVSKTGDTTVSVNTGYLSLVGYPWSMPIWTSGGFNTETEITTSKALQMTLTIAKERTTDDLLPFITAEIGFYDPLSGPSTNAYTQSVTVDFDGEYVDTSSNIPGDNYTASIDLASVQIFEGKIFSITQYVDYNVMVPGNLNRFYSFG